jgi:hypothetical protein
MRGRVKALNRPQYGVHFKWQLGMPLNYEKPEINQSTFPKKPSKPIKVFWHCAAMGNWREVAIEQLQIAKAVSIKRMTTGFLGDSTQLATLIEIAKGIDIELDIAFHRAALNQYEWPTIRLIEQWAKTGSGAMLYWHTKGVSRPRDVRKKIWRRLMQSEVVAKCNQLVHRLGEFNCIGVNWQNTPPVSYFAGNFWLSTASYVSQLESVDHYQKHPRYKTRNRIDQARGGCEFWISSGEVQPKPLSLVCSNAPFWHGNWKWDNLYKYRQANQ